MAGIDVGGHGGGKKPLNQELPLVPFIDFLLCCVMFLLVTAVWNQLSRIDATPSPSGRVEVATEPPIVRTLTVEPEGYSLAIGADPAQTIPRVGTAYDSPELARRLAALQSAEPNRHDLVIESRDDVPYADLVLAMDTVASTGLVDFSVSPLASAH